MEQEPVYVPSGKLTDVCHQVIGKILEYRQSEKERYVLARAHEWNAKVHAWNAKFWHRWFGSKRPYITPMGMELEIQREVRSMAPQEAPNHPMIQIHTQYGRLEHEAKDAIIMAGLTDSVPVSADFARGVSHLGIDVSDLRKAPFGFHPSKAYKK